MSNSTVAVSKERRNELVNKAKNSGMTSLTRKGILDLEELFIDDLSKHFYEYDVKDLLLEYYIANDNLDKIIYFSNMAFRGGHENHAVEMLREYEKTKGIEIDTIQEANSISKPLLYLYKSKKYKPYSEERINYLEKGAETGSILCTIYLFNYYKTKSDLSYSDIKSLLTIYRRWEQTDYKDWYSYPNVENIFNQIEKSSTLTSSEREELRNIIDSSPFLLYEEGDYYYKKYYSDDSNKNDLDLSMDCYRKSARMGYVEATYTMGRLYNESGSSDDLKKAVYYYSNACNGNLDNNSGGHLMNIVNEQLEEGNIEILRNCSIPTLYAIVKRFDDYETIIKIRQIIWELDKKDEYNLAEIVNIVKKNQKCINYLSEELCKEVKRQLKSKKTHSSNFHTFVDTVYSQFFGERKEFKEIKDKLDVLPINTLLLLGKEYYNNNNYYPARYIFQMAAKKGNADAMYYLGLLYNGTIKDKIGKKYFENAALRGHAEAMRRLGIKYFYGSGVGNLGKNYKKARHYLLAAADRGSKSEARIAQIMYEGIGGKENYDVAMNKLRLLAKKGDPGAKYDVLAHDFASGEDVDLRQLFSSAEEWYENDPYIKKIHNALESGAKVITVNSLAELADISIKDPNERLDAILKRLSQEDDNTIIATKYAHEYAAVPPAHFYEKQDMIAIIKKIKEILKDIDTNQNEEDIFMQIYIKLGTLLSYDNDAVGKHKNEKNSTSSNLTMLLSQKGVCLGFSTALKGVLDIVGIESTVDGSRKGLKGAHAYNQVKINDNWYYCDLTFDRVLIKLGMEVCYCLKSEDSFRDSIYHDTISPTDLHPAPKDYKRVGVLYHNNYKRLFKGQYGKLFIKTMNLSLDTILEPHIEPAPIKK